MRKNILFLCGTEFQLFVSIILSVLNYKNDKKTLVLLRNTRLSPIRETIAKIGIWDKVIYLEQDATEIPTEIDAIVRDADIVHVFVFGFYIYNIIFKLAKSLGKHASLTDEGIFTYMPFKSYDLNKKINDSYMLKSFDIESIDDIWLLQPELYADKHIKPIKKIDLDSALADDKIFNELSIILNKIFRVSDDISNINKLYFKQYSLGNDYNKILPNKYLNQIVEQALVTGDKNTFIRKHPFEDFGGSHPIEISLFNSLKVLNNNEEKLFIAVSSSAMFNLLEFHKDCTLIFLYKISYSFYHNHNYNVAEELDVMVNKARNKYPKASIYNPKDIGELHNLLNRLKNKFSLYTDALDKNSLSYVSYDDYKSYMIADENFTIDDWFKFRNPPSYRIDVINNIIDSEPEIGTLAAVVIVDNDTDIFLLENTLSSLESQVSAADHIYIIGAEVSNIYNKDNITIINSPEEYINIINAIISLDNIQDFVWILYAGDTLVSYAVTLFKEYRLRNSNSLFWYADEATNKDGKFSNPILKPDFNYELLQSFPYMGRNVIASTALLKALGGLDSRLKDLAMLDAIWRFVDSVGNKAIGHIPEVLCLPRLSVLDWVSSTNVTTWYPAVVQMHLERVEVNAVVVPTNNLGINSLAYKNNLNNFISIIIVCGSQEILDECIENLLLFIGYANFEVIVVDISNRNLNIQRFKDNAHIDNINIVKDKVIKNFAEALNYGINLAKGEVILSLGDNIRFTHQTHSNWMQRLVSAAMLSVNGIVSARIDSFDKSGVDQCGLLLGVNGAVGAAFRDYRVDSKGYLNRLISSQNVSAVSHSFMAFKKSVFLDVNGFNKNYPFLYFDIDFCLKTIKNDYSITLLDGLGIKVKSSGTYSNLLSKNTSSNGIKKYREKLYSDWLYELSNDSFYHHQLSKNVPGFSISRQSSRLFKPYPGRPYPVVVCIHKNWHKGGYYRVIHPMEELSKSMTIDASLVYKDINFMDLASIKPDVIIMQDVWDQPDVLENLINIKKHIGSKIVFEFNHFDAYVLIRDNVVNDRYVNKLKEIRKAINLADWIVVPTENLRSKYNELHSDVRIAPTFLPFELRNKENKKIGDSKFRIGCIAENLTADDLNIIKPVIELFGDEVEWVFYGNKPDGVKCEFHTPVNLDKYYEKLLGLNLDLGILPLASSNNNMYRDSIELFELGHLSIPVICSEISGYDINYPGAPIMFTKNNPQDWVKQIKEFIDDQSYLSDSGLKLKNYVGQHYIFNEDMKKKWSKAWGVI